MAVPAANFLHPHEASGPAGDEDRTGAGATHAWADVFVSGAGWVEFDPTNRIVASRNLIRVATTRTPSQATPVSGSFEHGGGRQLHIEVSVNVTRVK